jgi:Raf kinase inhibitor-like YbhB/YbcL family protein
MIGMKASVVVFLLFVLLFFGCVNEAKKQNEAVEMKLISPAFEHGANIPKKYTCDGDDVNPPLMIIGAPATTKSFALIVDDPDAPSGTWVHWIVWNIPPATKEINEGAPPKNSVKGINDFGRINYNGPCPPPGPSHTYRFKLYALDITLNLKEGATKSELEAAMKGHILARAELDGKYRR